MADQVLNDSFDVVVSFAVDTNRYSHGHQNCSGSVEVSVDSAVVNVSTALINYDSLESKWSAD